MSKTVALLVRSPERHYEALRSSLGMLLEDHEVKMVLLEAPVEMTEEYSENMELFDEMDGERYSSADHNVKEHGFRPISQRGLAQLIRHQDVVVTF